MAVSHKTASVPYPKFALRCSMLGSELRIRKNTSKSKIPVWFRFRSSLEGLAGENEANF
jgi:hypothetical protein